MAIIVALFNERLWAWYRRPQLKLILPHGSPGFQKVGSGADACYFFRLEIKNKGRGDAKRAEVYFGELLKRDDDGRFVRDDQFLPMDLRWAHIETPHQDIARDMTRHVNLGYIMTPFAKSSAREFIDVIDDDLSRFSFCLEVQPKVGTVGIGAGVYRAVFFIGSENSAAKKETVEIEFNGQWTNDDSAMFSKHMKLRKL